MGICREISINNKDEEKNGIVGNRIKEVDTKNSLNILDLNIYNAIKSVCKIITNNGNGSGFLIKLFKNNQKFFCLMTNEHVVTKEMIKLKQKIILYYDAQNERKEIVLNKDERFIEEYTNKNLDIAIIEIIKQDNINENYFLLPYFGDYNLVNQDIFIIQFPKGDLGTSKGKIIGINNYEITHDVATQPGSSGSPIFLENSTRVIGIHKEGAPLVKLNYGDFIYPIVKDFELKNQIYYENGEYYIGATINYLKHGEGIYYYKNGNIKYEGDFIDDEYEGNGKKYYEDGQYYIGQFKKGFKHGKGIHYYKNGNIKYEGDFIDDDYEGHGKNIRKMVDIMLGNLKMA